MMGSVSLLQRTLGCHGNEFSGVLQQDTCGSKGFTDKPQCIKSSMKDSGEWEELCRRAAVEQDPKKLLHLMTEINRLLAEKQTRLEQVSEQKDCE
jgi:hypothetical protein